MAPGGKMFRFTPHCGENVLRHGSHEWLPYSKNAVCTKPSNTNFSFSREYTNKKQTALCRLFFVDYSTAPRYSSRHSPESFSSMAAFTPT